MRSPACATSAVDTAPFGRFQLSITLLCAIVAMLDGFDTQSIAFVAPEIANEWSVASSAFGPVFGAGLFGLTIGALALGVAADRWGRKRVLLICVATFGIFALLTAAAASIGQLIVLRFLTGVGLGGAMPNIIALTNEYAPRRYKATLVTIMFCGFPLGSTLGGAVSAPLIEAHGWQWVFIIGGAMPLLLLPLLYLLLPESIRFLAMRPSAETRVAPILRRVAPSASAAEFVAHVKAEHTGGGEAPRFPVRELFAEGRAVRTLLVWTAFFMNLLVMYFLTSWLPTLLRDLGLSLRIAILSTVTFNLGGVIGGLLLGQLIDRRDPYVTLGTAYAFAAACIIGVALAGADAKLVLFAAACCGFGVSGAQIGLNALTANSYPTAIRSTGIGWALGVGRVGSILGPVIGGLLLAAGYSPRDVILMTTLPALIAAGAVFALRFQRA